MSDSPSSSHSTHGFYVEKDPGGYHLRWRVLNADGAMVIRFETKRLAASLCDVMNGNPLAAPVFYLLVLERELRRHGGRDEALRAAMLTAYSLGLPPALVKADPQTGEPLGAPHAA